MLRIAALMLALGCGCMRLGAPLGTAFDWGYDARGPMLLEGLFAWGGGYVYKAPDRCTAPKAARRLVRYEWEICQDEGVETQAFVDADGNAATGYGPRGIELVLRSSVVEGIYGSGGFGPQAPSCFLEIYTEGGDVLMAVAPCAAYLKCYDADYNCDGTVNWLDVRLVARDAGLVRDCGMDGDCDGDVDLTDCAEFMRQYTGAR